MLIDLETIFALDEYKGADPEAVKLKVDGLESAIRAYTNNDFTVRGARFKAPSSGGILIGASPFIKGGDRVQIVSSGVLGADGKLVMSGINDGLYDVETVQGGATSLNVSLYDMAYNDVMLVRYPPAVIDGILELLKWEATGRDKVGVSSETISRHSVSYYNFSESEMLMGYPALLMGFLKPYMKARF